MKKRVLKDEDLPVIIRAKDPFKNLEDYASSRAIRVREENLKYPIQRFLFSGVRPKEGLRVRIGDFFEILSQGIYGGELKENVREDSEESENEKGGLWAEPDITHHKEKILREVKAIASDQYLKLIDGQIGRYLLLQTRDIVFKDPTIRFEIFKYGIYQPVKKFEKRSLDELISALTENILYLTSLPFSVVFEMYRNKHSYGSRHDGERYDTLRRFSSPGLSMLLADPEGLLRAIGLDHDEFEIEKRKFPKGARMNKQEINQFPMLFIYDKEHAKWLERFKERIERERKDYKRNKDEALFRDYLFEVLEQLEQEEEKAKEEVPFEIPLIGKDEDLSKEGWSGDKKDGKEIADKKKEVDF